MKLLESPHFWFVAIALCVTGFGFLLKSRRSRKPPSDWEHSLKLLEEADQAEAKARKWDDGTVDRAVTAYLFGTTEGPDAWIEQRQLGGLQGRTHRRVLELLAGTTPYRQWVAPTGQDVVPEAPIHRACELLGHRPPVEAIPLLAPFLEDKDDAVRKVVASIMGRTGSPDVVPHLKRALGDPAQEVRGSALSALGWARETGALTAEAAEALFDDVRDVVEKDQSGSDAPGALFALDPKRAEEFFLSTPFRPESPTLHRALALLRVRRVRVPREPLLELIGQLRAGEISYPKEYLLREAMELLGPHRHPDDLPLFETLQQHPQQSVAAGAASAILTWHGIHGFEERLEAYEDHHGYASLTRPQQHYSAVLALDGEISNGGLHQYFFNSRGDRWRDALEGLRAMNDSHRAEVLQEAAAIFGKDGPSSKRRSRQKQLTAIIRANEDAFEALDERYYAIEEPLEVITNRYVLANPEDFR